MGERFRAAQADTGWITIQEAATHLRVSRQRVHQVIKAGGLVARKSGSAWLVSARSVEQRITQLETEALSNVERW